MAVRNVQADRPEHVYRYAFGNANGSAIGVADQFRADSQFSCALDVDWLPPSDKRFLRQGSETGQIAYQRSSSRYVVRRRNHAGRVRDFSLALGSC
jgi:hypothetical protein